MPSVTVYPEKLRRHLTQLESGSISESQLSEAVQLSRTMIQAYLRCIPSSITHLCLQQGLSMTDLSYDCIAEAFARDTDNTFSNIQNFIGSLRNDLNTIPDRDLFLAYKGFLISIAEAQFARLYAQTDPAGSRVHRNIRDCLRDSKTFGLRRDFRRLVLFPLRLDALDHLGPFPPDELAGRLVQEASSRHSIPEMLETLHHVLACQSQYRRTISLIDVASMFKNSYQTDFSPETSVDHPSSSESLSEFELRRLRHEVENALKEKILLAYLVRGKVTDQQAQAMFNALQDLLEDWSSGDSSPASLYSNFNNHLSIAPETYEQEFRSKMEYLLKMARQEFSSRLMREL